MSAQEGAGAGGGVPCAVGASGPSVAAAGVCCWDLRLRPEDCFALAFAAVRGAGRGAPAGLVGSA